MTSPKLSTHQSGYGGRGYFDVFGVNGGETLMSITTAIGALDKPGLRNWERQQVAAFAVTHVDDLLNRSEEVGYRYLMAVPKFLTPEKVDGVVTLIDWKTSAAVRDGHKMQLGAIGAALTTAREVTAETPGAIEYKLQPKVSQEYGGQERAWFVEEPLPDFEQYSVVQIRPGDFDNQGTYVPAFCRMHVIPQREIDAAFKLFTAAVDVRLAQKELKMAEKLERDQV